MKHLRKYNENKEWWIEEIEDMCQFLKDYCGGGKFEVRVNGEDAWNITMITEITHPRGSSIEELTDAAIELQQVNIEVYHLISRLNSTGFTVTYYLLENTQHMNFDRFSVKIQGKKRQELNIE